MNDLEKKWRTNAKSVVELLFYYKTNETGKSIFKNMVSVSKYSENRKINLPRDKKLSVKQLIYVEKSKGISREPLMRELAIDEIIRIQSLLLKKTNTKEYHNAVCHFTERLYNNHYFNLFQDEKEVKKYYYYLTSMVQPSAEELIHHGLKNSFYHFFSGEEGTQILQNDINTIDNSLEKVKTKAQLRLNVLRETSLVHKVTYDEYFSSREQWFDEKYKSNWSAHFIDESTIEKYYAHLFTALNPSNEEKEYFKLKTTPKIDDEVPF